MTKTPKHDPHAHHPHYPSERPWRPSDPVRSLRDGFSYPAKSASQPSQPSSDAVPVQVPPTPSASAALAGMAVTRAPVLPAYWPTRAQVATLLRSTPWPYADNDHVLDGNGEVWSYNGPADVWRIREGRDVHGPAVATSARSYQRLLAEFGPIVHLTGALLEKYGGTHGG